jgi:hypothetical protein
LGWNLVEKTQGVDDVEGESSKYWCCGGVDGGRRERGKSGRLEKGRRGELRQLYLIEGRGYRTT